MPAVIEPGRLAWVGLGSNLGESMQVLASAMVCLQGFSNEPMVISSVWQSAPVDCPPGSPDFLNVVAGFLPRGGETPESLLGKLQELERRFGRQPCPVRNAPRSLDLDLIAFGGELRSSPGLRLPHPRAHVRAFVLAPLSEVAPGYVLPLQSRTVSALLEGLGAGQAVWRRGELDMGFQTGAGAVG